jgi:hypothetical protein
MKPVGLDVGTHMLIKATKNDEGNVTYGKQVDAFFTIDSTDEARNMLDMLDVPYIEKRGKISVLGEDARKFANMFKQDVRRPMQTGCLNKKDIEALGMLTALISNLLGDGEGAPLVYSVTSQPLGTEMNFDYHRAQIESILKGLNYETKPIQEARAIALAELASNRFTGLAISCGSGTTTVWLGLLGMDNPNFQFSIDRGGDWIDSNSAENFAGLTKTKVQTVKERGIKIKEPQPNTDELEGNELLEAQAKVALSVYYRKYIQSVIKGIKFKLDKEQLPEFEEGGIPVVIAGGTSAPDDFLEVFEEEWKAAKVPLEITGFTKPKNPFDTVAKGCLVAAQLEAKKRNKA